MAYTYKYPRPAVTADCIVITREAEPKVLLIQRGNDPFKGGWFFSGGFMNMDETTEQCAVREVKEETGLQVTEIQQIGAYSKVDRDPRGRTVTIAYLAVIDESIAVTVQDDAAKAQWFPIDALPPLAFDHENIMRDAINCFPQALRSVVRMGKVYYLCKRNERSKKSMELQLFSEEEMRSGSRSTDYFDLYEDAYLEAMRLICSLDDFGFYKLNEEMLWE